MGPLRHLASEATWLDSVYLQMKQSHTTKDIFNLFTDGSSENRWSYLVFLIFLDFVPTFLIVYSICYM